MPEAESWIQEDKIVVFGLAGSELCSRRPGRCCHSDFCLPSG